MSHNNISKKQYIIAAQQIIRNDGLDALSIRRLGGDLQCNTANLYRYFDSLEELSMYAALSYLRNYLCEVGDLLKREGDCIKQYFGVWDCYCKHAFANAVFFDLLFWSKYHTQLYIIMKEYYALFPEEVKDLGEMRTVFMQGDFDYRDYLFLDDCVRQGRIDEDNAVMLNRISINMFKGFFKKVLDLGLGQAEQNTERKKFLDAMYFVFAPFVHDAPN